MGEFWGRQAASTPACLQWWGIPALPLVLNPMSGAAGCPADQGRAVQETLPGFRWLLQTPLPAIMNIIFPGERAGSRLRCWYMNALQQFNYAHTLNYSELWLNHYDYLGSQGCLQGLSGRLFLFSTVSNTLIDQVIYNFCCRSWCRSDSMNME